MVGGGVEVGFGVDEEGEDEDIEVFESDDVVELDESLLVVVEDA